MNKKKRELEKNELADVMTTQMEKLKPHMTKIVLIGCALIVAILGVAFLINTNRQIAESQWQDYFTSARFADPRAMDIVAEQYPNTTPGQFALIYSADATAMDASNSLVNNRQTYTDKLKNAAEKYEQIVESANDVEPFARLRATYALAYTYESLGRFQRAEKMYQQIIDEAADTPEAKLAEEGLARVTDESLTSIYAAFEAWEPPPSTAPGERSGLPPRPDISFGDEAAAESETSIGDMDEGAGDPPAPDQPAETPEESSADDSSGDSGESATEEDRGDGDGD